MGVVRRYFGDVGNEAPPTLQGDWMYAGWLENIPGTETGGMGAEFLFCVRCISLCFI